VGFLIFFGRMGFDNPKSTFDELKNSLSSYKSTNIHLTVLVSFDIFFAFIFLESVYIKVSLVCS
jgi:hypothetical protein